jgi:exopolyphosphatase/guanosine-5'-triphosphate,3'-diphosphate pyrophosphatase
MLTALVVFGGMCMLGAIDIGTNSVRLLIGEIRNGRVVPVYRNLNSTRLGEGVNQTRHLKPEAIRRTVEAVHAFMGIAKHFIITKF